MNIYKNDRDYGTAAGDATLGGAVYRVYYPQRVQLVAGRRCDFLHTDLSERHIFHHSKTGFVGRNALHPPETTTMQKKPSVTS